MAKVKLKLGINEIEVDSRDFYVDNQTLSEVINSLSSHLPQNKAEIFYDVESKQASESEPIQYGLESLHDAESFESEFDQPKHITPAEIKSKLRILETSKFFHSPKTTTETVQQLREYGWIASPLDVSKALAKMALNKEIMKNSSENITSYFIQKQIIA